MKRKKENEMAKKIEMKIMKEEISNRISEKNEIIEKKMKENKNNNEIINIENEERKYRKENNNQSKASIMKRKWKENDIEIIEEIMK